MTTGTLYIVATPIGNLEDITLRALRILREADLVAAEDTRHTKKLLTHFGISKPLTSYFDHNQQIKGAYIIERLRGGESVALVSDAGTPCISDPGYQLIRDAAEAGIPVVPIPGPSAVITAVSASGLPSDRFAFEGFLPSRKAKRQERIRELREDERLLVFYESPHRVPEALQDMVEILGDREAAIGRELTKIYEEISRGTLSEILQRLKARPVKGEIVVLVAPAREKRGSSGPNQDWRVMLEACLEDPNLSLKDAVKCVVSQTGAPRGCVYDEALKRRKGGSLKE